MSLIICSKSSAHRALNSPIGGPLTKYKAVLVRVHLHSSLQRNPSFGTTERVFSRKHESRCFAIILKLLPNTDYSGHWHFLKKLLQRFVVIVLWLFCLPFSFIVGSYVKGKTSYEIDNLILAFKINWLMLLHSKYVKF